VIGNEAEAAEKSPVESAAFRVNPDSEQVVVMAPEIVAVEVEKAKPGQDVASVEEISDPPLL